VSTIHSDLHDYTCLLNEDIDAYIVDGPRWTVVYFLNDFLRSFLDYIASVVGKRVWVLSVGGMILMGEQKYCGYWCIHCSTGIFIEVEYSVEQKQTNTDLFLGCFLKLKVLWQFAALGATHAATAYYILEDLESSSKNYDCTKCSTLYHDDTVCVFCGNITP
jgi:hypothetical protein